MVQLVFVHGVATRSSPAYDVEEGNRHRLLKEVLFAGAPLTIRAPRWGDLVPPLSHGGGAFAGAAGVAAFGGGFGGGLGGAGAPDGGDSAIADLAREDSTAALDAIYATVVQQADAAEKSLTDEQVAAFKAIADAMADETAKPAIPPSATDEDLAFNLDQAAAGGGYGIGSAIGGAVTALADRARNTLSTGLSNAFRDELNPLVGRFLGDVFVYLKDSNVRKDIHACVRAPILAAHAQAKTAGEPLMLMGHSLGGVVLYDMLSSPAEAGLPADLKVDALLTVGSQPGLFEEMGLFAFKSPGAASTPGPQSVAHWLNVFDPIDLFGFRATPMFAKANDFAFDSVTGLLSAHTTYFKRPQFHARMRKRLQGLGLI